MQRRPPHRRVDLPAGVVELDVVSGVRHVLLGQVEAVLGVGGVAQRPQVVGAVEQVHRPAGAAVARLDDQRVVLHGDLLEQPQVADEPGAREGQAVGLGDGGGHRLVADHANGLGIVDRRHPERGRRLEEAEAGAVGHGLEDDRVVGATVARGEPAQTGGGRLGLENLDVVPPGGELVDDRHRHPVGAVALLDDEAEAHCGRSSRRGAHLGPPSDPLLRRATCSSWRGALSGG